MTNTVVDLNKYRETSKFVSYKDRFPHNSPFPPFDNSVLDYNVSSAPVIVGDRVVDEYKALVREPDNIVLDIVGRDYEIMQNRDLFTRLEDEICKNLAPEQLVNVGVKSSADYHGSRAIRQYIFGDISIHLPEQGKYPICYRLIAINGFGSHAVRLISGAIDFFCLNGMIRGVHNLVKKVHKVSLRNWKLEADIKASIDVFYKHSDVWLKWVNMEITDQDAIDFINTLKDVSDRGKRDMIMLWADNKATRGANVWALYSTMTAYATHKPVKTTKNQHEVSTQIDRQLKARTWEDKLIDAFAA